MVYWLKSWKCARARFSELWFVLVNSKEKHVTNIARPVSLSVLESWLDYTGELEPPEPLARLPQLKHRIKRLLTQLDKVQQISQHSTTWGRQRTSHPPHSIQKQCSWGSHCFRDAVRTIKLQDSDCWAHCLLPDSDCVSPVLQGSVWWSRMLTSVI